MKKFDIYLANLWALNVKLHNLHWFVEGPTFKATHEYLEHLYDLVFERLDETAEVQRQLGEMPKASMKEYLELTTVKEREDKMLKNLDAIKIAYEDFKALSDLALEIREEADKEDNFLVANLMEDDYTLYKKELWFMEMMLK